VVVQGIEFGNLYLSRRILLVSGLDFMIFWSYNIDIFSGTKVVWSTKRKCGTGVQAADTITILQQSGMNDRWSHGSFLTHCMHTKLNWSPQIHGNQLLHQNHWRSFACRTEYMALEDQSKVSNENHVKYFRSSEIKNK